VRYEKQHYYTSARLDRRQYYYYYYYLRSSHTYCAREAVTPGNAIAGAKRANERTQEEIE
jgi:hypothetical protein